MTLLVDARGLKCPWPALRLAKAMRGAEDVRLLADDPAAPREIAALAAAKGWHLIRNGDDYRVTR
jgi:tRNA 2-thiouridine synthesizing protein A